MPNTPITMSKLRTIIRLYEDRIGLKTISTMARTSRNTVKKILASGTLWVLAMRSSKARAMQNLICCSVSRTTTLHRTRAGKSWSHFFLLSAKSSVREA